ncbi:MAG TPA: T9SS type A sorting domain-containing protein [Amoebophilaceae bacterium]|nr:T9SS type A sorting domain-containing protein [Amoebophilaceae bacterium]
MKKLNPLEAMKKLVLLWMIILSAGKLYSKTLITSATANGVTNSITVNWGETDVSINPPTVTLDRYQIRYKIVGGVATTIDNISNALRTYTLTGLASGQTYEVELIEVIRVQLPPSPFNVLPYMDTPISSGIATVALNAPPTAVCTPLTVSVGANCMATVTAAQIGAGSSDPNGDAITYSISPVGPFGVGTHSITLTVTDIYGASSSCVNTLTVVDSEVPKVLLKDAVVNLDAAGVGVLSLAHVNAGITDNCGVASITLSRTHFGCIDLGFHWITVTVRDAAGNTATGLCRVNVKDVTAPNAKAKNAVINLNFDGYAVLDPKDIDGGSWDLCGSHTLKLSKSIFSCQDVGNNSVTLIVTDAAGNESRATAVVKIIDNIPPYLTNRNIEVAVDKDGKPQLDLTNTTTLNIYDACGLSSVTFSEQKLTCEVKTQDMTVKAIDKNGNPSNFVATITLKDKIAPEVKTKPVNLYLGKDGKITLTAEMMNNGSTDNCKIDSIYFSKNTFTCENIGKDSVIFYARDNYGNISMKKEGITVIDSMAPSIITKDFTVILDAQGKGTLKVEDIDNGSTDNCGIKSKTLSKTTFDCTNAGKVEVTYTLEDNNGNKAEKKLQITVAESTKPTLKLKDNLTFSVDKEGFLKLTTAQVVAEATDNCGIKQTTLSKESFNCSNVGKNDIIVTTTDNSGNITTATASITITDAEGNCLCSYAMLASESIEINGTNLEYGGLGTYQAQKTVTITKATYGASNVFVKSDILSSSTPPALVIKGIAPSPLSFEENTKSTRKKLRVKNGKTGDFSESEYGKVKIGKNATLTYKGTGDVYFKTLKIKKGGKLNFEQTAKVHIKTYVRLNEDITINEGQENVKIFAAKNVGIEKGSQVNAYIHSQAGIEVKNADANKKTTINGLLTATKIKSGENVVLKGQPTDCNSTQAVASKEDSLQAKSDEAASETMDQISQEPNGGKITFGPNPSSDYLNVGMSNISQIENIKINIRDTQGRQVGTQEARVSPSKPELQVDLRALQNGLYLIELKANTNKSTIKVQVLR